jgi:hypothetical protein
MPKPNVRSLLAIGLLFITSSVLAASRPAKSRPVSVLTRLVMSIKSRLGPPFPTPTPAPTSENQTDSARAPQAKNE